MLPQISSNIHRLQKKLGWEMIIIPVKSQLDGRYLKEIADFIRKIRIQEVEPKVGNINLEFKKESSQRAQQK